MQSNNTCALTSSHRWRAIELRRKKRRRRWLAGTLALVIAGLAVWEMRESRLQSWMFSRLVRSASWQIQPGPADRFWFPVDGPYPERLGYTRLGDFVTRLRQSGFEIAAQAQQSMRFRDIVEWGFNPIYPEKAQAGLVVFDHRLNVLHSRQFPQRQFAKFDDIPPLIVGALLYIENRELLEGGAKRRNPAVDWGRLARVAAGQGLRAFNLGGGRAGGSTLATQIEKYRYSPGGRTQDADDKLRQMISASLRAYRTGPDTVETRRQIVLDYLNSVPLGGVPGYGEVNGLGDGLWAWFGADFSGVSRSLSDPDAPLAAKARALRQVLTLLVAQRRPSGMLADRDGGGALARLTDSHVRLLAEDGFIDLALRDEVLATPTKLRDRTSPPLNAREASFVERKAVNDVRLRLGELLDVGDLYALDRFDLEVTSSFDANSQSAVTGFLSRLNDPATVRCLGLNAFRMLDRGDPRGVHYSLTLFEHSPTGPVVRVQADNLNQPLDINAGTKLDLGSSAKLRTLVSYLNVVADLHRRFGTLAPAERAQITLAPTDALSRWAVSYLSQTEDRGLTPMLAAALERRYSADPRELFFTGGGVHKFGNFKPEDDAGNPTVMEALEQSVNLPFVRILRDVVHYYAYEAEGAQARALRGDDPEVRRAFLDRFAEREGLGVLRTFWHKYRDVSPQERLRVLSDSVPSRRSTQAAAYMAVVPEASFEQLSGFLKDRLGTAAGTDKEQRALFDQFRQQRQRFSDLAYLARAHLLELWLVRHLMQHPESNLKDIVAASVDARREAGRWLMHPRYRSAQDQRIAIVVEVAAFERVAEEWKRLGYPFDQLVPSLATAIGSSADRPAALAELMGILLNDGVRRTPISITHLRFAPHTPYETVVRRTPVRGRAVLPPEVAQTVRQALQQVVQNGTAIRLAGVYRDAEGKPLPAGGKTGTGDHRSKVVGSDGSVVSSRVMNRAATFAFYLGERHFGVVTAFVPGQKAAAYGFTSSLPVQILRELEPALRPLVNGQAAAPLRCMETLANARP